MAITSDPPASFDMVSAFDTMTIAPPESTVVEVELADGYSFVSSTNIGFISNLPNFVGLREYTDKQDFTIENLQFFTNRFESSNIIEEVVPNFTSIGIITPMFSKKTYDDGSPLSSGVEEFISFQIPYASVRYTAEGSHGYYQIGDDGTIIYYDPTISYMNTYELKYSSQNEKDALETKHKKMPLRRDFVERIYSPPEQISFSNSFSIIEESLDSLLGKNRIEGEASTNTSVQQSATESEIVPIEPLPETSVEIDVGSYTYGSY